MSDETLLNAWCAGDRQAGMQLIGQHYDAVVRFFQTKANRDADDLVQRTFLICSEKASTFRGTGSFRAFLFGIARNVLLEHIRGKVRDGRNMPDFNASSIVDLNPGVATQAGQRADQRMLVQALQLIPVENQMLLELYYWEDLGVAELAQALDVAPGTIKSRLHRARAQLRDALDKVPDLNDDPRSVRLMIADWLDEVHPE